ncbi:MAG: hypothetical protein LAP87_27355 [Acidobacteriia bacterium]|nr:hypothetical protein [Terriglobia bacterium]
MDVAKGFDGVALSDDNDLVVGKTVGNGTEILALDRTTRSWVPVPLPDHKAGTWLAVFGFDGTTLVTSPAHGTLRRFKLTEDVPGKE